MKLPEETTPIVEPVCKCRGNAEVLVILHNLHHEAEEHAGGLASLHEMVQSLAHPVPLAWTRRLRDEYARHHEAVGKNVLGLDAYLASKANGR